MDQKPIFSVGDEVYVVLKRSDRIDKLCPHCDGVPPKLGSRCIYCQGYREVYDRTEVVHWWIGPEKITAVHTVETEAGTSISYCVDRTFNDQHEPQNVFETQQQSEEAVESRRVHLRQVVVVPV